MTKLEFAARMLGRLRREVTNQVSRHALVAAAACGGEEGATAREISDILGDPDPSGISTQLGKYSDMGLLQVVHGTAPRRYTVSPLGLALITPFITAPQTADAA